MKEKETKARVWQINLSVKFEENVSCEMGGQNKGI